MASGTPKYISYGAEDLSSVQDLPEIAEKGTVILKSIIYAQKGPKYALVNGKNIINIFGEKTFDINSEYYFHNIKFLRQWVSRGSSAFVEKLDALNSTTANMRIYIDILETNKIPNYIRDSFGNLVPDGQGGYKVDSTTPEITGIKIKFVKKFVSGVAELPNYGNLVPIEGTMEEGGVKSRMYPFLEWNASYRNSYYNNIGLGFNSYNQYEIDTSNLKKMKSLLYGFKLYKRADGSTTPKVVNTLEDMKFLDVSLKSNTRNPQTDALVSLGNIFSKSYYNEKAGSTISYKETENIFIYNNYLELILKKIKENEANHISDIPATWDDGETTANLEWFDYNSASLEGDEYLINLFTCASTQGVPYYTVVIDETIPATLPENTSIVSFTSNTPVFLSGGTDGKMSLEDLEAQTSEILKEYSDPTSMRLNNIKYPGMFFADSGYNLNVKKDMYHFITLRSETAILNTTELYSEMKNRRYNAANSIGVGRALVLRAMLAPESTHFGTDCIRAATMLGSFETENEVEYTAATLELVDYVSEMMGSTKWKAGKVFDKTCYGRHGTKYHPDAVSETSKDTYWDLGIIVPEITNRDVPKYIGLCTMYPNTTSVANNIFTMFGLCVCERLAKDSWLDVGGDVTSTNSEFIKLATDNLTKKHDGVFGGVFKSTIDVTILGRDKRNGNTYTVGTNLFGNVAKTGCYHSTKVRRQDAIEE